MHYLAKVDIKNILTREVKGEERVKAIEECLCKAILSVVSGLIDPRLNCEIVAHFAEDPTVTTLGEARVTPLSVDVVLMTSSSTLARKSVEVASAISDAISALFPAHPRPPAVTLAVPGHGIVCWPQ